MPDSEDPVPFSERGTLASLGARRRWRLFGTNGAKEPESDTREEAEAEPFVAHSMLGALASRSGPEKTSREPERRSILSLSGAGADSQTSVAGQEPELLGPLTEHSTLAELAGLEEHRTSPFPIERAILISLVFHLLLVVLLIVAPARLPAGSKGDLFAALVPQERDESPIPVIFQDAPGAARPNPKKSPLSDADRRAAGGDPARPKSDSPYVPPSRGVAGLAPGPKSPRIAGSEVPPRAGAASEAERRPSDQSAPAASSKDPSQFPSQQPRSGPREATRLAGLDSAIREAARGAVGGEGGAPAGNPDGGFVDSGPLSFDTTWYDWGPYAAEMIRRIKLHWDVPELARLGWKGSLTVRFFILADGTVADAKILRGSGIPPFDFAAFQAIVKSSPFRPLPADLGSTREGVTVTFFYNMRPDSNEADAR